MFFNKLYYLPVICLFFVASINAQSRSASVSLSKGDSLKSTLDEMYSQFKRLPHDRAAEKSGWISFVKRCDSLIEKDTGFYKAYGYYMRGTANYFLSKVPECMADHENAIAFYPYLFESYESINVLNEQKYGYGATYKGYCEARTKIWKLAEKNFLDMVTKYPQNSSAWNYLAKSRGHIFTYCKNHQKRTEAISAYKKSIELDSFNSSSWFELGYIHQENDSSIFFYMQALRLLKENWLIREHLLRRLIKDKKDYSTAMNVVNTGLEINPSNYNYYYWRSEIYKALNKTSEAKADRDMYYKMMRGE